MWHYYYYYSHDCIHCCFLHRVEILTYRILPLTIHASALPCRVVPFILNRKFIRIVVISFTASQRQCVRVNGGRNRIEQTVERTVRLTSRRVVFQWLLPITPPPSPRNVPAMSPASEIPLRIIPSDAQRLASVIIKLELNVQQASTPLLCVSSLSLSLSTINASK